MTETLTAPSETLISARLRTETADHHERIENARLFKRLSADDFSMDDYREILSRFYGFYAPLEKAFSQHANIMQALDYDQRFKLPLIAADLRAMGMTDDTLAAIPECTELPSTDTAAHAMGCIYVMEGSTHGAQFIARTIRQKLNLTEPTGVTFYEGYGKNTHPMWAAYKTYLDGSFDPATQGDEIVEAASATFNALQHWMS